ncbi:hypothetical protein CCR75_009481 [Bremia lactucae]|uniref:Choline transporter-like protein n=1 Tax=Bremia lactucae TaxID=4779 RepID=A0A976FM95_BRELC|nr:hypothetical protein CCR75_009481 [Bremia lactucae]
MELDHENEEVLLKKIPHQVPGAQRRDRKDFFFAMAFAANCAIIVFLALGVGLPNVSSLYFTAHNTNKSSHGMMIFLIFFSTSCIGSVVSALWLRILQYHAERVISWTLQTSIGVSILVAFVGFYNSNTAGKAIGFLNVFVAFYIVLYYASIRQSIAFAASNLTAASRILRVFPGVITSAYVALLAQIAWVFLWGVAVVGILAIAANPLHDSTSYGNVTKTVIHCITAGAVGDWWFQAHDGNTIQRAQTRALTTSLGSICLGSLLVATLNALHTLLLSTPRRKAKTNGNAFLEFLVKFVTRHMMYFNKYAFCQVALYGKDFYSAGTDTMHLFQNRGWTALLKDTLISSVLSVGCLAVGTVSGLIGSTWLYFTLQCTYEESIEHPKECQTFNVVLITFVTCASIGYAMCAIMSSILDSIVATIFVCFAEDPAALQRSHPEEHARLVNAWTRLQPDLLTFPTHMV